MEEIIEKLITRSRTNDHVEKLRNSISVDRIDENFNKDLAKTPLELNSQDGCSLYPGASRRLILLLKATIDCVDSKKYEKGMFFLQNNVLIHVGFHPDLG